MKNDEYDKNKCNYTYNDGATEYMIPLDLQKMLKMLNDPAVKSEAAPK